MKRLGRGLADIIEPASTARTASSFVYLKAEQIKPNRFQPRTRITEETLEELKASIKRSGMIEPVVVRPLAHGTYELVAGERRLRASQAIGLQEVPAIVKTLSDKEALEISLVENVQRVDLNPVDEARGYARLLDEFGYTQEDIASAVGKDRATIANFLRVLTLPEGILAGLGAGEIALGHAKALLTIAERARQLEVFHKAKKNGLSVRAVEALAGMLSPARRRRARKTDAQWKPLEDDLRKVLGTKVSLTSRKKGGRIVIEFFSTEDLARLAQLLGAA